MDELKEARPASEVMENTQPRPRRGWLRALLYLLALLGLMFVGLLAYLTYDKQRRDAQPVAAERTSFDEAQMIDTVMTEAYGKYSEEKRGWLYVHSDDQTYVMRVIHHVHMDDTAGGDQLYLLASGAAINAEAESAVHGAFHVFPDPDKAGGLRQASNQEQFYGSAVTADGVKFSKLSKTTWAWFLTRKKPAVDGFGTRESTVILAPHEGQIATLAEIPRSSVHKPQLDCAAAKEVAERIQNAEPGSPDADLDYLGRCDDRHWVYKLGNVKGNLPAPITITFSGTQDGQALEGKTWKMVFDSKAFRYNVPEELGAEVSDEVPH